MIKRERDCVSIEDLEDTLWEIRRLCRGARVDSDDFNSEILCMISKKTIDAIDEIAMFKIREKNHGQAN